MTPLPKRGFWTPPSHGTFSTPLRCKCSVFPGHNSTTEQTRSSFGGVQKFSGERILWYVFLPPYVLHPPYHGPRRKGQKTTKRQRFFLPVQAQECPDNPYPLIKGVKVHPLNQGGMGSEKRFKTSGFGQSAPLIKGVNLHPLN